MPRITLRPPAEGIVIEVPLGRTTSVVVSGTFQDVERDSEVSIAVAIDAHEVSAIVDHANNAYQASVSLACPSQVSLVGVLRSSTWKENGATGHWDHKTYRSNTLRIRVQDTSQDPEFLIVCRCVDAVRQPVVGRAVEVFHRRPNASDHKIGETAISDIDGRAEIRFRRSDFAQGPSDLYPDLGFRISDRGQSLDYQLPGEPNDHGMLRSFIPRPETIVIFVLGAQGFVVRGAIRDKYRSLLEARKSFLGRPMTDETPTPDGRGFFNHFEGGSIYWTPDWGAFEVHGLIRQKWAELGWEQGFLGFPVSDELELPPDMQGGRYSLFEHGLLTWRPGQTEATVEAHHLERIYAHVRAHIVSRFFAIGGKGRRNQLSMRNELARPVPPAPGEAEELTRWRIVKSVGENPWLCGSLLHIAMAVEHDAGHAESGRVLEAALSTLDSLQTWAEPGAESTARLPQRWDAGIPTEERDEAAQFLDGGNGTYSGALAATDFRHVARRAEGTLHALLGPTEAARYVQYQTDYCAHYRAWELSMDELTGLVTSCWIIGKLSRSATLTNMVRRQASLIGNYLADYGYILVRPMGGVSWRGGMGLLPALEFPFARALESLVMGANFGSRTDFRGAMQSAGYWPLLEGPITRWQIAGWSVAAASALLFPQLANAIALPITAVEDLVAQQTLSPSTIFGAWAVQQHGDCFDINEVGEAAASLILRDAPNKAGLYRALAWGQADYARFDNWSVNFHSWIGLTGLDDTFLRDTFRGWFERRQSHPELETKDGRMIRGGAGTSRSLFAAGVAALVIGDRASEERLLAGLERAIVELFSDCYFDPKLPLKEFEGSPYEVAMFPWYLYGEDPNTPYSPLDFMAGAALAFWHARRRVDAGNPVTTPRFPAPLEGSRFSEWPRIAVPVHCVSALEEVGIPIEAIQGLSQPTAGPDGYDLFNYPLVPRRPPPQPEQPRWATDKLCDVLVTVRAGDRDDVATGVTVHPGFDIQIDASGDIFAGDVLVGRNDPDGNRRLINDARWPLHTGIDAKANAFCLLGRLNGYFRIGAGIPRMSWNYPEERRLFLRINDDSPGDGNGQFDVRIQVWGPRREDPARTYRPPNVLRDGGVVRTTEKADMIEVEVTANAVDPNEVQFKLVASANITWRKEIIRPGAWTIWTEDSRKEDANNLDVQQLGGATLTFAKMKGGGGVWPVLSLGSLEAAVPGSRVTFNWVSD